jgi:hypothetical protein
MADWATLRNHGFLGLDVFGATRHAYDTSEEGDVLAKLNHHTDLHS